MIPTCCSWIQKQLSHPLCYAAPTNMLKLKRCYDSQTKLCEEPKKAPISVIWEQRHQSKIFHIVSREQHFFSKIWTSLEKNLNPDKDDSAKKILTRSSKEWVREREKEREWEKETETETERRERETESIPRAIENFCSFFLFVAKNWKYWCDIQNLFDVMADLLSGFKSLNHFNYYLHLLSLPR